MAHGSRCRGVRIFRRDLGWGRRDPCCRVAPFELVVIGTLLGAVLAEERPVIGMPTSASIGGCQFAQPPYGGYQDVFFECPNPPPPPASSGGDFILTKRRVGHTLGLTSIVTRVRLPCMVSQSAQRYGAKVWRTKRH
ncbi:hypothetical protein GW17_00050919 [Ensete ventricosum]|nr:hypothetical protein GW17_00050919 [Ensete ventricosum]